MKTTNEEMFKASDDKHINIVGELLTIKTIKEYDSESFSELINPDYFMHIDLHTKIIFKSELWIMDNYIGRYEIVKQFKGQ